MSAKREKQKRRDARLEAGITKEAERGQREFEAAVARQRLARVVAADQPIVRRDGRRKALAVAALMILAALLFAFALNAGAL